VGLLLEVVGAVTGPQTGVMVARVATLAGAWLHAAVIGSLFAERYW
jgi:hypothetical protein